ncbi:hypothetical protein CAPTEDRAFT_223746 [Capitella teleta]|uniref:Protein quiver n=1 Tax=Capitella teleta TaxID=283909 RepID=R7T8B9_CAPTE|nr:hypothetical protein CAPTEDRAFT_223746 [Capitella teleta]|eukprot:ELT89870.1 hypothetical protein CAPTEDRAFT_223746 [Capitella teleta]
MKTELLFVCSLLLATLSEVLSLQCYRCHSSQPGCGKELNIRLQHWHSCPNVGDGGGENFCVKVIERKGSEISILRECLMTLRYNTGHREKMPTIQRHGYCEPARNNDPWNMVDTDQQYCFCNDWNGCNTASSLGRRVAWMALLPFVVSCFFKLL